MSSEGVDSSLPLVGANLVISAATVLPALATIFTALRFYVRKVKQQRVLTDDWLLVPTLLCLWSMGAFLIYGERHGVMGYPSPKPPPGYDQVTGELPGQALLTELEYLFWIFTILTFGLVKLSVLFFYRRVFVVGHTPFNAITWALIGFSILWTVAFAMAQIFACGREPSLYWGPLIESGSRCVFGLDYLLALAATDFASDAVIFFLPVPLIWRLHMSTRRKLVATSVLLVGSISLVASAIRLTLHVEFRNSGYAKKVDVFLNLTLIYWWSILEAGIAVIAVNLPVLHHLIGSQTVQSMVNSVRSVISLRSLSPRRSSDSNKAIQSQEAFHENKKTSLQATIGQGESDSVVGNEATTNHTRAM